MVSVHGPQTDDLRFVLFFAPGPPMGGPKSKSYASGPSRRSGGFNFLAFFSLGLDDAGELACRRVEQYHELGRRRVQHAEELRARDFEARQIRQRENFRRL